MVVDVIFECTTLFDFALLQPKNVNKDNANPHKHTEPLLELEVTLLYVQQVVLVTGNSAEAWAL